MPRTRCQKTRRICKATNKCVLANPPRAAALRRFRCPATKRQCPNRLCYPSRLFTMTPEDRSRRKIAKPFRDWTARRRLRQQQQRQQLQFVVSFGPDVPQQVRDLYMPANTEAELAVLARKIVEDDFCIVPGELDFNDIKAHFDWRGRRNDLLLRLKPYSILIVAKQGDEQRGIALVHMVQMPMELPRRQAFDPGTMFQPTGLAVDLICANRSGRDLIRVVHELGHRLFAANFIGVFLESIGSARDFYINRARFTPLNPAVKLQSMKDGAATRYIDRDNYNMRLDP